jgi:hypothetical protein
MAVRETVRLSQWPVIPDQKTRVVYGGGEVVVVFPAQSVYELFFPQGEAFEPTVPRHLKNTGIGYAFGPDMFSFDRQVEVYFGYPEGTEEPEKLGIYQENGEGGWVFLDNQLDRERRVVGAKVWRFSRYALLADKIPPLISDLQPGPDAVIERRRPRLAARVEDVGAGIGREEDVVMELDGQRLISEYDPEAHTVVYPCERDLGPGRHHLVVRVKDRSGNQTWKQVDFTVE